MLDLKKGSSGCATPKEIIHRIFAIVDEEHFLVFCWQYSLFGTQVNSNHWLIPKRKETHAADAFQSIIKAAAAISRCCTIIIWPFGGTIHLACEKSFDRSLMEYYKWQQQPHEEESSWLLTTQATSSQQHIVWKSPKMSHLNFWHFPPIFVLLKLTCLVTLFDRKLQIFKNSPKWTILGIFN